MSSIGMPPGAGNGVARARPLLGVLLTELDGDYHRALIGGVCRTAVTAGADLLFFPGHMPGTPFQFDQQFSAVFEFVPAADLDGLLVFGATLQSYHDAATMQRFLSRFTGLPTVCIGFELANAQSVLLDNYTGFKQLVAHFIAEHGHRHIAFIEGPATNPDAIERLQAYLDAHAEAGLPADPALRASGMFHEETGRDAMLALLSRKIPFTAVLCANDQMAHGAHAALVEQGLRIPDDVALGGFDDLLSASRTGPSLTTVNQSIATQGETATLLLLDAIHGIDGPAVSTLPTRVVLRRSCGCLGQFAPAHPDADPDPTGRARALVQVLDARPDALHELTRQVIGLAEALLLPDEGKSFEAQLSRFAVEWLNEHGDMSRLHSLLLRLPLQCLPPELEGAAEVYQRLQRGHVLLVNELEARLNGERVLANSSALELRHQLTTQVGTNDLGSFLQALGKGLTNLKVGSCFISLYTERRSLAQILTDGLPAQSRLIFALQDGVTHDEWRGQAFETARLLPEAARASGRGYNHVLLPMFYLDEHFGFILLENLSQDSSRYEDLRHEIATGLHRCLLVKELAAAHELLQVDLDRARSDNETLSHLALRDPLTALFNRRGLFDRAAPLMHAARLGGQPLTLIFADLDGLKLINDTHGHEEGDAAIRAAARLLQQAFRQEDVVARVGGDEFVMLTRGTSPDSIEELRRRLAQRFDEHNRTSGKPYRLGCSVGGCLVPPDSQEALEDVIVRADRLLYEDKRRKRAPGAQATGATD